MQYRCADCQKLIKGPKPGEPKHKHYYCDECLPKVIRQLMTMDAACRNQIIEIRNELADITGNKARLELPEERKKVLVCDGIDIMAKALGKEVKVAEMNDNPNSPFYWEFSFENRGIYYHQFGSPSYPPDKAIAERWEARHGTFY